MDWANGVFLSRNWANGDNWLLSGDKACRSGDNVVLSGDKVRRSGDNGVLSGDKQVQPIY